MRGVLRAADGSLVVNEIAPRPHNSGHYSQNACDVSQFELQVRAMAGLPLTQPRQHSPAVMLNLLGDLWFREGAHARPQTPPWAEVLALPGTHLHLYGKAEAKPGRKMGHLNVTAATAEAPAPRPCRPPRCWASKPSERRTAQPLPTARHDPRRPAPRIHRRRRPRPAQRRAAGPADETVYGLAADAASDAAVAQIFAAKGRPSDHPLIVHVAGAAGIAHFASDVPPFAQALVDAFWPGPLTLILPRRPGMATAATGGQDSVGLRCRTTRWHWPCCAPARRTTRPWAARPYRAWPRPSANRFGRVSPTTAQHVQDEFGGALLVLDGGPCGVGIESTIIDCTRGVPVLLRPGAITREQIAAACGLAPLSKEELPAHTPRASGTLEAHYAPAARVRLMDARALQAGLDVLGADAAHLAVYARTPLRTPSPRVVQRRMPDDAAAAAQQLFAALRGFDDAGVKLIWIETPPDTPDWEGVRDRLQRASAAG